MTEGAGIGIFDTPLADGFVPNKVDEFLLLREAHHRLANTLTVLLSALRCDFEPSASPALQGPLARLENRILAFDKLHRSLLIGSKSGGIAVQSYLEHLCRSLSDAVLEPVGLTCEVHVDPGELPSERCELLGLIICELVMNSAKHAFRNRADGVVRVELIRITDAWLCVVSDNGEGMGAAISGIGSKIVGQLVGTMGGRFATTSGLAGTSTAIICPVAEAAHA